MAEQKKYNYYTKTITCPNGKRKYIRAKTKSELNRKVEEAKRDIANGVNITAGLTVSELTQQWVDIYKRPKLRPQSLQGLLAQLNGHVIPYIGAMRVRDVKAAHIADIMNNHGYESKSTNTELLSNLRSIFDLAIDNGLIAKSPVPRLLEATGKTHDEEVPLTREQAFLLIARLPEGACQLFTVIALFTGMRKSEILGLTWDCIDFDSGVITVKQQYISVQGIESHLSEDLKTGSAYRTIPMTHALRSTLAKEKLKEQSRYVVHVAGRDEPIERSKYAGFSAKWSRALPEYEGRIHAHLFRHTFTSWCVEAQMDVKQVQYLVGHSDVQTTLGTYSHFDRVNRIESTRSKIQSAILEDRVS